MFFVGPFRAVFQKSRLMFFWCFGWSWTFMDVYCGLLSQIQIHHNILLFNLMVCEFFSLFVSFSLFWESGNVLDFTKLFTDYMYTLCSLTEREKKSKIKYNKKIKYWGFYPSAPVLNILLFLPQVTFNNIMGCAHNCTKLCDILVVSISV